MKMKIFSIFILSFLVVLPTQRNYAQSILEYITFEGISAGTPLTNVGWSSLVTNSNPVLTDGWSNGIADHNHFIQDGSMGAKLKFGNYQDVRYYLGFNYTGIIKMAFTLRTNDFNNSGGKVIGFQSSAGTTAMLYIKDDGANYINFQLCKGATCDGYPLPEDLYFGSLGAYLLVLEYNTNTNILKFYIISTPTVAQPTADIVYSGGTSLADVRYVIMDQSFHPELEIGGIRVARYHLDFWEELWNYPNPNTLQSATNLSFNNYLENGTGYTANWNSGSAGTKFIVFRRPGSAIPASFQPTDNTKYSVGQNVNGNTVAYIGSGTTFNETTLTPGTQYFYKIFPFNGDLGGNYFNYCVSGCTTNTTGSTFTRAAQPTTQASNILKISSSTTPSSIQLNWTNGNGSNRLLVANTNNVFTNPSDGRTYSENSQYGQGDETDDPVDASNDFVVHSGSGPATVTGLNPETRYYFRVYDYNGGVNTANYRTNTASNNPNSFWTLANQPNNLVSISKISQNASSITLNVNKGAADKVLLLCSEGSPVSNPINTPTDGINYIANNSFGSGTTIGTGNYVVYNGTASSNFVVNNLNAETEYYFKAFPYNENTASTETINYFDPSGNEVSYFTYATASTNHPTNLSFSNITDNSIDVDFDAAANGAVNPDGYIVFRTLASGTPSAPSDGTIYSIGNTQGQSTVVYIGNGTSFTDNNSLLNNTLYEYRVWPYTGSIAATRNYKTGGTILFANQTTLAIEPDAPPTGLTFSNVTTASYDVSFSPGFANPDGFLVVRRVGVAPTFSPVDGVIYSEGPAPTGNGDIISVDDQTFFNETGLPAGTSIFYKIFPYNGSNESANYSIDKTLTGSTGVYATLPTEQVSNLTFNNIDETTLTLSFNAPASVPDGYIILRSTSNINSDIPSSGIDYSINDPIGSAVVVYEGLETTFNDNGLIAGTQYYYSVYAYNGSNGSRNYLTTQGTNVSNTITIPAAPTMDTPANVTQTSMDASWNSVQGAIEYYIDVSTDPAFTSFVGEYQNKVVAGTTINLTNLLPGTTYSIRVRCKNANDLFSDHSPSIQQILIPDTPVLASSNITQNTFSVTWNQLNGSGSYKVDISQDDFVTYILDFENKSVSTPSVDVSNLTDGDSYQVRVRSSNSAGDSPNSEVLIVFTIPATPLALDPDQIRETDFKARWEQANGAVSYELDVSQDNFSTFLSGYNAKSISGSLEDLVEGLSSNTQYQYRVRSVNTSGKSPSSNPVIVTTSNPGSNTLQKPIPQFSNAVSSSETANIDLELTGGVGDISVELFYKKIVDSEYQSKSFGKSGDNWESSLNSSLMGVFGIEFYVEATDAERTVTSDHYFIYRKYTSEDTPEIPLSRFGGKLEDYQIISIPIELDDNLISSIFEPALGEYDKSKWRLVRYQNGQNVDYQGGINRIRNGEGYWFNSLEKVTITPGTGTIARVNQSSPFVMNLSQGWNLIGNPYPFDIQWSDVLAANGNPVGELLIYNSASVALDPSNILKAFSGGFVFASSATSLEFPVSLVNSGVRTKEEVLGLDINQNSWMIPLSIQSGNLEHKLNGFGMHPDASHGFDKFDGITPPQFIQFVELNSYHSDFFDSKFSRDIVTTQSSFSWEYELESNTLDEFITLKWPDLAIHEGQLVLEDVNSGRIIDMGVFSNYQLPNIQGSKVRIHYSISGFELPDAEIVFGVPYPNPSSGSVNIPFSQNSSAKAKVLLKIHDQNGKLIYNSRRSFDPSLIQIFTWEGNDLKGAPVDNGIYFYQMEVENSNHQYIGKFIITR